MHTQSQYRTASTIVNNSRARWLSFALVAGSLVACDVAERNTAPVRDATVSVSTGTATSLAQAFVDAQGTTCLPGHPCPIFNTFGVGQAVEWCDYGCVNYFGVDFGGVYPRWWARKGLPAYPPYYFTGAVTERRLSDGRRKIIANIHGHNTFVHFGVTGPDRILVGSWILEFPLVSQTPRMPTLGDAAISAELIVPADFVGMPDIVQMFGWPIEGMEILRYDVNVTTTGPLRAAYKDIPAGTVVDVHGSATYLPKLAPRVVNNRRMVEIAYEPMSRVTVRRANSQ
jgi:hypothetical protein